MTKERYYGSVESHREKARKRKAKAYTADPQKFRDAEKRRREQNPERYRAVQNERYRLSPEQAKFRAAEYRKQHPDRFKERYRESAELRDRCRSYRHKRRAAKGTFTPEQIAFLHVLQEHRCFYCEKAYTDYHVDHMIPLSRGGTNDVSNLAIACPSCNLRKHAKMPWVFLAEMRR